MADAQPKHRYLGERLVVTGELVLTRPAHFGNGDADELTDLPLLLNEGDERALITGASLAGALRNYLRERQCGYECPMSTRDPLHRYYQDWTGTENDLLAASLFGGHRGDPNGDQSPLIVDDALSSETGLPRIEQRDGVAIDGVTHTAEDKKKYDYELLAAGTRFQLRFELLLEDEDEVRQFPDDEKSKEKIEKVRQENSKRIQALTLGLQALARGKIRLGARKRRGFGCCEVKEWSIARYRLHQPNELLAWLSADREGLLLKTAPPPATGEKIAELLSPVAASLTVSPDQTLELDQREWFEIEAEFVLESSLLVRSGFEDPEEWASPAEGQTAKRVKRRPDTVHLHTWNGEAQQPVLSGTSIAGALRQRAQRIANTLADNKKAEVLIDSIFGPRVIKRGPDLRASRLTVNEAFIEKSRALVQTRIKIDRFTGGTLETALLEEEPTFGGTVKIGMKLHLVPDGDSDKASARAEIGLLLLVLKDLWLGDLPLGGESSIGRGCLRGQTATISVKRLDKDLCRFLLSAKPETAFVNAADAVVLQSYVDDFNGWAEAK